VLGAAAAQEQVVDGIFILPLAVILVEERLAGAAAGFPREVGNVREAVVQDAGADSAAAGLYRVGSR
ncbi:MAG: hypothetical protein J6U26_01880, partial [Lachnospiraceae bacterium]|nr:hypothetical protein [Lachnospiraceae bacterium]